MLYRLRLAEAACLAALAMAPAVALSVLPATATAAVTFGSTPVRPLAYGEVWSLTTGDFDGDGRPDALVPLLNPALAEGGIALYAAKADGALRPGIVTTGGWQGGTPIAAADFNRDGDLDAVSATGNGELDIFLGRGDGGFTASAHPGSFYAYTLGVGDFNGDGNADIVGDLSDGLFVLPGDGRGGFGAAIETPIPDFCTLSLDVGDFEGDGGTDIAAADDCSDRLLLLGGVGDGTFIVRDSIDAEIQALRTADLDGDGDSDVLLTTKWGIPADHLHAVIVEGGSGALGPGVETDGEGHTLAVGDLNGDGRADVVTLERNLDRLSVHLGLGGDRFGPAVTRDLDVTAPRGLGVADFDGDGRPDVVVGSQVDGVQTLLNASLPTASLATSALDFGPQAQSTIGAAQAVTVTNGGDAPLHVLGTPAVNGAAAGDFLPMPGSCDRPVPAGGSCHLAVRFLPSGPGPRVATLSVETDAAGPAPTVALSGTGTALPAGNAGEAGAPGAQGPKGDPGPAGRDRAAVPLAIVLSGRRLSAKAGRRTRIALGVTAAGRAELTVLRGKRRVAFASTTVHRAGTSSLTVRALPRGRYSVRLSFRAADGRTAAVATTLDVRR